MVKKRREIPRFVTMDVGGGGDGGGWVIFGDLNSYPALFNLYQVTTFNWRFN